MIGINTEGCELIVFYICMYIEQHVILTSLYWMAIEEKNL